MYENATEHDIQALTMLALQREWPDALILRQNTGGGTDPRGQFVRFGTPGQGDLRVVINGYAVEVECKASGGRQSPKQKNYQRALERAGGIYVLSRDPDYTVREIKHKLRK